MKHWAIKSKRQTWQKQQGTSDILYDTSAILGSILTAPIFSQGLEITEFGINNCGVLIMKREKFVSSKGLDLPNSEKVRMWGRIKLKRTI